MNASTIGLVVRSLMICISVKENTMQSGMPIEMAVVILGLFVVAIVTGIVLTIIEVRS